MKNKKWLWFLLLMPGGLILLALLWFFFYGKNSTQPVTVAGGSAGGSSGGGGGLSSILGNPLNIFGGGSGGSGLNANINLSGLLQTALSSAWTGITGLFTSSGNALNQTLSDLAPNTSGDLTNGGNLLGPVNNDFGDILNNGTNGLLTNLNNPLGFNSDVADYDSESVFTNAPGFLNDTNDPIVNGMPNEFPISSPSPYDFSGDDFSVDDGGDGGESDADSAGDAGDAGDDFA
jgi:hypothetical protein